MDSKNFLQNLNQHLPKGASELVWPLLEGFHFQLMVTKERASKHGDYRLPMYKNEYHKISVNGTLNKYAFLLTFLHEIAHMHTYHIYGRRIKPHGKQWKKTFTKIAKPFLKEKIWPEDISIVLHHYFVNPKASSAGDASLTRVLRTYDQDIVLSLEDVPEGTKFTIGKQQSRWFIKGKKRRSRFLCKEIETNKEYTVHGMAKISVENEQ